MGIMLVYDITNAKSFENISKWLRNIDEVSNISKILELSCLLWPVEHVMSPTELSFWIAAFASTLAEGVN